MKTLFNMIKKTKDKVAMFEWFSIASTKKCFWCKTKFDEEFFKQNRKSNFNLKMLLHFHQTHSFEPINVLDFIKETYVKKYPESLHFFNKFEPLFEKLST